MDYVYLVDLNSYLNNEELKPTDTFACALSSKNIFAFSSECYVYLVPLEKPNELLWAITRTFLLVGAMIANIRWMFSKMDCATFTALRSFI